MTGVRADMSELNELIRDFEDIPDQMMPELTKVVSRGSLNIKRDWAKRWEGHTSIRHLPRAINYDVGLDGPHIVEGEIGPAHDRTQGVLGHVIEFGKAEYGNMRNAPIPGGVPALDMEEPKFVNAIADVGEDALKQWGSRRGR